MYIKLNNGVTQDYTIGQLRKDNPNISFPRNISDEVLAEYNVFPVSVADKPLIDERTQVALKNTEAAQINGSWIYEWTVSNKTSEQVEEYDAALSAEARAKRDYLLAKSDWVVIKAVDQNAQDNLGIQVPMVWLNYRQSLRDITSHVNFPNLQDSDWPVAP